MKSTLVSASILAIAALTSASSFAESNPYRLDQVSATSTKTRAEVRAEVAAAGARVSGSAIEHSDQDSSRTPTSAKTRAEVQAEVLAAGARVSGSAIEHSYPVTQ